MHDAARRSLELFCCHDQLQVGALAGCEFLARQVQLVEEKWKDRILGKTDGDLASEAHLFGGMTARCTICVSPELSSWVALELSKESAVLKERRKAREERALAKPK